MDIDNVSIISGCILEEETDLTLVELCKNCQAPAETIIRLVDYGVIMPTEGADSRYWRFHRSALIRADKAIRLKRDLGINSAGIAMVLDLLDEVQDLRRQLTFSNRLE